MRIAKCTTICLVLVLVLALLAACARETELAFETIEQDDGYGVERKPVTEEPYAFIITTPDEIPALKGRVSQRALDRS